MSLCGSRCSLVAKSGWDVKEEGTRWTFSKLEHFLAVADERTFTRAAERVYRTQPALSQSIKKLEDQVGSPLFSLIGKLVRRATNRSAHDAGLADRADLPS